MVCGMVHIEHYHWVWFIFMFWNLTHVPSYLQVQHFDVTSVGDVPLMLSFLRFSHDLGSLSFHCISFYLTSSGHNDNTVRIIFGLAGPMVSSKLWRHASREIGVRLNHEKYTDHVVTNHQTSHKIQPIKQSSWVYQVKNSLHDIHIICVDMPILCSITEEEIDPV